MRQFALFINNEVKGPLTEYEVQDLIQSGEVTADTLCAPLGSEDWQPLSTQFTFGSGLKLSRRANEVRDDDNAEPATPRLDPDLRRQLLLYGLADAATVDQVAPAQATVLIAQIETTLRQKIFAHRVVAVACLALGLVGGFVAFKKPEAQSTLGTVADTAAIDDPANLKRWERLRSEVKRFERTSALALAAPFAEPKSNLESAPILLKRLVVRENLAFNLRAKVQVSEDNLVKPLENHTISLGEQLAVLYFEQGIPEEQLRRARTLAATLTLILSEITTKGDFAQTIAATMATYPEAITLPESASLRTELGEPKITEVGLALEKVKARAREIEKLSDTKSASTKQANAEEYAKWARELWSFADRLTQLRDQLRIQVNPDARRTIWSEFNRGEGAELIAWALAHANRTLEIPAEGTVLIEEIAQLKPDEAAQRLLVRLRIQEDVVLLPWDSPFLTLSEQETTRIPNATFLQREIYRVVGKIETGGRKHSLRGEVGGRTLKLFRESPKWYYLSVGRERDTEPLLFKVSAERYAAAQLGQQIPVTELAELPIFEKALESPPAEGLSVE